MKTKQPNSSQWISISDMMTGLMVIFMFIAINYILQVLEFKFVENEIYNSLEESFEEEISKGMINLNPDGTINFTPKDSSNLFAQGEFKLSKDFKQKLDSFIPKYLNIITQKEFIDNIKEIRIEGHTDEIPLGASISQEGFDNYENNLWLSSQRAQSVLRYIRSMSFYKELNTSVQERLEFLFTANGLSYARAINNEGDIAYISTLKEVNNKLSRRVEFRVVTSNEKLMNTLTKN